VNGPLRPGAKRPLRALLVDDHAVVRAGYRHLLSRDASIEIVGEAADAGSAYAQFCALAPDVVILDLALPGASGLDALARIVAREPRAKVLVFSMYEDAIYVTRALAAGACGYLTKSSGPELLLEAIHAVARGERYLSPDVAGAAQAGAAPRDAALSQREFEVLRLLAGGATVTQVAEELHLSEKTVANYQSTIKQKLGASNAVQMLRNAAQRGLLDSDPSKAPLPRSP
jgi:DNA-binding NarL/FixJ family response regulator